MLVFKGPETQTFNLSHPKTLKIPLYTLKTTI